MNIIKKQLNFDHEGKSMKRFRNRMAIGLAALCFSSIVMAGDCGYMPGYKIANGGGFVALTAYVEPSVYVGINSKVCGFNFILGNAIIDDNATIDGFATISGKVTVKNYAHVGEYAHVESNSLINGLTIYGGAEVTGNAVVLDQANISGASHIYGHARLTGFSVTTDSAQVYGNARINNGMIQGNARVHGLINIDGRVLIGGTAQLCDDITVPASLPLDHGNTYCQGLTNFIASSSSSTAQHSCVIGIPGTIPEGLTQGGLYCWGDNSSGQISSNYIAEPRYNLPYNTNAFASFVATGPSHTCVITDTVSGSVRCWGKNDFGQIGDGTISEYKNSYITIPTAYKISIGASHTCAITISGTYCWGKNDHGQLGLGDNIDRSVPTLVTGTGGFSEISSDANYTCGVYGNSGTASAKCWGSIPPGLLGTGNNIGGDYPVPTNVSNLTIYGNYPLKQIAVSASSVCVYDSNFQIICWGVNFEIGNGGIGNGISAPNLTNFTGDESTKIYASSHTRCAHVQSTGRLFCWGYGGQGELGTGQNDNATSPVEVLTVNKINLFGNQTSTHFVATSTDALYNWGIVQGAFPTSSVYLPAPIHDDL